MYKIFTRYLLTIITVVVDTVWIFKAKTGTSRCYTPFTRYNRLYRFDNRLYRVNGALVFARLQHVSLTAIALVDLVTYDFIR